MNANLAKMDVWKSGEIRAEIEKIDRELENCQSPEQIAVLNAKKEAFWTEYASTAVGLESLANYITEEKARIAAINMRIDSLKDLQSITEVRINSAEKAIMAYFDRTGEEKLDFGTIIIGTRKSQAVKITDEKAIPSEFVEIKQETRLKKKEIGDALKKGGSVPGAEMESRKNLMIKGA